MQVHWTDLNESWDNDGGTDGGDAGANGAEAAAAGQDATATDDNPGEKDKGGKPSDAEAALLKEVMEKKAALQRAKEKADALERTKAELEGKLKQFDGVDLDEVKTLIQERKDRELAELEKKGEWNRLKAQMLEAHNEELNRIRAESEAKIKELEEVTGKSTKQIHELTIGRSFSESTFIREDLTLTPSKARVIYGSHFELQDGKIVAYDKPAGDANRTMLIDGDGEPLDFNKAIAKLVEADPDRDNLLRSKIKAGSGSDNDPGAKGKGKQPELRGKDRILAAMQAGALKPIAK